MVIVKLVVMFERAWRSYCQAGLKAGLRRRLLKHMEGREHQVDTIRNQGRQSGW